MLVLHFKYIPAPLALTAELLDMYEPRKMVHFLVCAPRQSREPIFAAPFSCGSPGKFETPFSWNPD